MFSREYRDLAHVPRWSIIPVVKRQSVAEHSYFVALYAIEICRVIGVPSSDLASILIYAIQHDRSECYISDIPGPVKRGAGIKDNIYNYERKEDFSYFGDTLNPSDFEKATIKVADLMDEFAYWWEEARVGNYYAMQMKSVILIRLKSAAYNLAGKVSINRFQTERDLINPFLESLDVDKIAPLDNSDVASPPIEDGECPF